MIAFDLHRVRQSQQHGHRGEEHRGGLPAFAGPYETPDGLCEEQRCRRRGRIDADAQARDVDAFGDHAHGDHPPVGGVLELFDPLRGSGLIGQDHRGLLSGDLVQPLGVGACRFLVGGDDEAAGVVNGATDLGESDVRGLEHGRDPIALGIQRGAPGLGVDVLRGLLTEDMRHLVAGLRSPLHGSGIGEEQHGTDDGVLEGTTVSVRVVRHRGVDAVLVGSVGDERDR